MRDPLGGLLQPLRGASEREASSPIISLESTSEPASGPGGDPLERADRLAGPARRTFPTRPRESRPADQPESRRLADAVIGPSPRRQGRQGMRGPGTVMRARPAQGRRPAAAPVAHRARAGRSLEGSRRAESGSAPSERMDRPRRARLGHVGQGAPAAQ